MKYCVWILILWLLCVFNFSCNGQKKIDTPKETTIETKAENITSFNPFLQTNETDSLFFIEGQLCQHLRRIFEDSKGNLWFGTNVYGLMCFDGKTLKYFDESDGVGGGRITAIVEDKKGNVWFGTYKGLTKYDGETFVNYTQDDGLLENEIWSILIDQNDTFWIGTNSGVSQFDGKEFKDFNIPKAKIQDTTTYYSYDRITSIMEDRKGDLWFGTDGFGITKYDGESFIHITKREGLSDNTISEIIEDSKGNIWIGTMYGGLSVYNGEGLKNFTSKDNIEGHEVSDIYEDPDGNIWIAIENFGIYKYDGDTFANYYKDEGLLTNGILSMLKDSKERFWFGGWGGLFRFNNNRFASITKNGPWN